MFSFSLSLCLQLLAQVLLFLCINTAGMFISYLSDRAQRQAFLETRRCIEARLRLETENQRQVSLFPNTLTMTHINLFVAGGFQEVCLLYEG